MTVVRASSSEGTGIDPDSGLLPSDFVVSSATDAVVYLAQSPHVARMPEMAPHMMAVNALSPVQAAAIARTAGATRFIYASTGNVYSPRFAALRESDPVRRDNWYALSKIHAEEALALFQGDMEVTSLRIFGLYGPSQTGRLVPKLIDSVINRRPIHLERPGADSPLDGGLRISLLHVHDAARMIGKLLGKHGVPILNLASDVSLDIREICDLIGERLGIVPQYLEAPRPRNGNMVADLSLLRRTIDPEFTKFRAGMAEVLASLPWSMARDE